jgi:hypothetical protein
VRRITGISVLALAYAGRAVWRGLGAMGQAAFPEHEWHYEEAMGRGPQAAVHRPAAPSAPPPPVPLRARQRPRTQAPRHLSTMARRAG